MRAQGAPATAGDPAASFTRRGALVAVGLVVLSIVATALVSVFGDALFSPSSAGSDSFSRSALGHHAFVAFLEQEGRTVLVSRARTAEKAAAGTPTLLLEPWLEAHDDERAEGRLDEIVASAKRLLVVLPKRTGPPDFEHRGWVERVGLVDAQGVDRLLEKIGVDAKTFRPGAPIGEWTGDLPAPELQQPQLLHSDELEPLLECEEGILVGELDKGGLHLVIVSDPDVLTTHGLGDGDNAELALAVLDRLGGGTTLLLDETLHGHELEPSLVHELLRFPLVLATLQALAALALLAWAAMVPFGRPVAAPPVLRAGKDFLVRNMADLLRAGGHAREAAGAYLRATREEILARIPPPGGAEAPDAWLRRLEAARGRAGALASLERQVAEIGGGRRGAAIEALRAAQRIQRWREELTHGAAGDPREARGRSR